MRNKLAMALFLGLVSVTFTSCDSDGDVDSTKERQPIELSRAAEQVRDANIGFALNLLKEINKDYRDANFIMSPLSLGYTLSIATYLADSLAVEEICTTLGGSVDEIKDFYTRLVGTLSLCDNAVNISQSFWLQTSIVPDNLDLLKEVYDLRYQRIPETGLMVRHESSQWTAQHLYDNTYLAKVSSAIYSDLRFEARWKLRSTKILEKKMTFRGVNRQINCDFLSMIGCQAYYMTKDIIRVPLQYGNGSFSMDLVMPLDDRDLQDVIDELSSIDPKEIFNNKIFSNDCTVKFPKFELHTEIEFPDILNSLGINQLFSNDLDPSKVDVFTLQYMSQFANISVTREGTKVVAGTGDELYYAEPLPLDNIDFDRPFLYLIREYSTNTILFAGAITDL